jgi:hypothetical protein
VSTFNCDYETFRQVAGDFIKAIPTTSLDELDAGLKCVQLHYLGLNDDVPEYQVAGAAAVLRIVSKEFFKAEFALTKLPH